MITAGTINTNFNIGAGFNDGVYITVVQPDGKILVGGHFTTYDNNNEYYLTRLNSDGSLDGSFVTSQLDNFIRSIEIESDGKILVGGRFSSYNGTQTNGIIRLNTDGTPNQYFGLGFYCNSCYNPGVGNGPGLVRIIKVQPDGKILVGGSFNEYNGNSGVNNIVRLNYDGSVDSTFNVGSGFDYGVFTIELLPGGLILLGGDFNQYNGNPVNKMILLSSTGSIMNIFGGGFDDRVQKIVVQNDGKILIGGHFTNFNGTSSNYLIRLTSTFLVDNTYNFNYWVNNMLVQSDGRVLVGGQFSDYDGINVNSIVRLNPSGSYDGSFYQGSGFDNNVMALSLLPNNNYLVGGWFNNYDNENYNYMVSLNNDEQTYQYQYVYSGINCDLTFGLADILNPVTYIIGSDVELSSGDTVSVYTLGSPTRKQCVQIVSEYNIAEVPTHVYDQTYGNCLACLSVNTVIAGVTPCSNPNGPIEFGVVVSNQYQIGDIISITPFIYNSGEGPVEIVFNDCFKIVEIIPYDVIYPAPQTEIIEYQPQESCEICQSCMGRYYVGIECFTGDGPYFFKSHQNLNLGDTISFSGTCVKVVYIFDPTYSYPAGFLTNAPVVTSTLVFTGNNSCDCCINSFATTIENMNYYTQLDGDGSITNVDYNTFQIVGPNDGSIGPGPKNTGYSYMQFKMCCSGTLTFNWEYITNDTPGYDWGFYYVGQDQTVDFNQNKIGEIDGSSGVTTINYSAGDWISIGVYSTDSVAGPGILNVLFSDIIPCNLNLGFESCDNKTGYITIPYSSWINIPYSKISTQGLELPYNGSYDDESFTIDFPTGFSIDFLGTNYTSVNVSSNPYITFGGGGNPSDCCFDIPYEIPSDVSLPGVFLSFACPNDITDYDAIMYKLYTGLTDNGNTLVLKYFGTDYCDEIATLIYGFKFYKNNKDYFDLVIEKNTQFYNDNPIGGVSDGSNPNWVLPFNSSGGRSYRFRNTLNTKANFGDTPAICGQISNTTYMGTDLGQLYSDATTTYESCLTNTQTFDYTGNYQTFVAPITGTYTLETWGAQGGDDGNAGGNGGYAIGNHNLTAGDELYVYVGGVGTSGSGSGGGWNNGGNPGSNGSSGGGGGATDIRFGGFSLLNRIIVAGAGGGAGSSGTKPGAGGGLVGIDGEGLGGTQSAGGFGYGSGSLGQGGDGFSGDGGGGGAGYYGGGAGVGASGTADGGGGGGSSYIGSVLGGITIDGLSEMPNPNGGTMFGKTGNGFVKISWTNTNACTEYTSVIVRNCITGVVEYFKMKSSFVSLIQENGFIFASEGPECYELLDTCLLDNHPIYTPIYFYLSCEDCLKPRKVGDNTRICYTCNSDINNGVQQYYVTTPPHPIWTNQYGKAIEETSMVTLGGMKGLNG